MKINNPQNPHNNLMYSEVLDVIKTLTGKVFTQLDACITNDRQLKSLKDCIRNDVATAYSDLSDMAFPGINKTPVAGVDFDEEDLQEISLEEAIGV